MTDGGTVWIVDDDPLIRRSMAPLIRKRGYQVEAFATAQELLAAWRDEGPSCLVVDFKLPGMDGLSLQRALQKRGCRAPVIFISGHGTIPATVKALQQGALDFLEKPFHAQQLYERIDTAIAADRQRIAATATWRATLERYATLTAREREVMAAIIRGQSNKEMAAQMQISPRTVENHRAHVMEKMAAANLAELCTLAHVIAQAAEPGAQGNGTSGRG